MEVATRYSFRLFVAGRTERSSAAEANLRALCESHVPGRFDIEVVENATRKNPCARQLHESVHDHFAGAVEAAHEALRTAAARAKFRVDIAERTEHSAIVRIALVAQQQRIHQRVGQHADADLQGAAVAHECARMQAQRVFGRVDRRARQRK